MWSRFDYVLIAFRSLTRSDAAFLIKGWLSFRAVCSATFRLSCLNKTDVQHQGRSDTQKTKNKYGNEARSHPFKKKIFGKAASSHPLKKRYSQKRQVAITVTKRYSEKKGQVAILIKPALACLCVAFACRHLPHRRCFFLF